MTLGALLGVIIVMAIIGFAVWLITTKIPMDDTFKVAIIVITVIVMLIFVLRLLGVNVTLPNL